MSKTACWGTNESFDCARVYFGYGSRYDLTFWYKDGIQVSLEALKVMLRYDYPLKEQCLSTWDGVSLKEQMKDSYIHIIHPEWESWFNACKEYAGTYLKENHDKFWNSRWNYYSDIPWEEQIMQLNLEHFKLIRRVHCIDTAATQNIPEKKQHPFLSCRVTDEELADGDWG